MQHVRHDEHADPAEELAWASTAWILDDHGPDPADPSLYSGQAGILLALQEAYVHFAEPAYGRAVERRADHLTTHLEDVADSSLYFGLTGVAYALQAVGRLDAARRALRLVRTRRRGERWGSMFELLAGNAGIGLGALHVGDLELAVDAVTPYVSSATATAHGVNWPVRPTPPRSHHLAHGTLGIVYALAAVGRAANRPDLIDLALGGAADVVGRNEGGPDGFLVPHSDPPHRPDLIERYSLGWCNGPAGDAQVFRLLFRVTDDSCWVALADRCWQTVTASGLPRRIRPGFWDNNGRCCGTAGVLALALDRIVENGDDFAFADTLVTDLSERATTDSVGARWSNLEYRSSPAELAPRPGWAMGNAGIVRELLRYARVRQGRCATHAVAWPDQLSTGPSFGVDPR